MSFKYFLTPEAIAAGCVFEQPRTGDAGYDIYASEGITLGNEGDTQWLWYGWVSTGLHLAVPEGYVGLVRDRSSMAGYGVYTHAGVIDSSYRGEVRVWVENNSGARYRIAPGDKIAQLIVVRHLDWPVEQVNTLFELGQTERGDKGFGSTGR